MTEREPTTKQDQIRALREAKYGHTKLAVPKPAFCPQCKRYLAEIAMLSVEVKRLKQELAKEHQHDGDKARTNRRFPSRKSRAG